MSESEIDFPALAESAPQPYGPYVLLEKIGSGGMAEVFRAARQGPEGFLRLFALKRIVPRHAESPEFVQMFCNEARLSALLNHPNLVQVYDFGEVEGSYYLAMEYLKGHTALAVMKSLHARQRPFPAAGVAYIGRQVALGLGYAHGLKGADGKPLDLVHRDINPSNIMLLKTGGVKLLDFGIAKAPSLATHATQSGLVKGKLSYASPEQLKSDPLDGRSDVFSLGVTMWEMLTMKKLFGTSADFDTVTNVMNKAIRPPSALRPDVPPQLDRIILDMLERDPAQRPGAKAIAARLGQYVREAHFMEESLGELLRELFGAHTSRVVTWLPGGLPITRPSQNDGGRPTRAPLPGLDPGAGTATRVDLPVRDKLLTRVRQEIQRLVLAARRRPARIAGIAGLAVVALVIALALGHRPAHRSFVAAERVAAERNRPETPADVIVELDSRPSGAVVRRPDGSLVGQTPLVLRLPWSRTATAFMVELTGFAPLRYEVVPERDSMTTLDLRQAAPP